MSTSFTAIDTNGVRMVDLKPKGYENNSYFTDPDVGGTWGDFVITFLDEGGEAIGIYAWEQAYNAATGEWDAGSWSELMNEREPGAFDVIPVGMSMFFTSPEPEGGESYTLPNSGEVITKRIDYVLPEGTCQWGNPRATSISIYDLVPTGYLNNSDFKDPDVGGTWGDFVITFLDEGGDSEGIYAWEQAYNGTSWEEGGWSELEMAVSTTLQPGDGVFVTGAFHSEADAETPYCITLPAQNL